MKQLESYDTEDALIEWLNWDLNDQKNKRIADDDLIINIGKQGVEVRVAINFDFNFDNIISHKDISLKVSNLNHKKSPLYCTNCHEVDFMKSATFQSAIFPNYVDFGKVTFENEPDFSLATFKMGVSFDRTIFKKGTDFSSANFEDDADTRNEVGFCHAEFLNKADFRHASFSIGTIFNFAKFKGNADFTRAVFANNAEFQQALFEKKTDFINTVFKNNTDFSNATFTEKANFNMANFNTCKFSRVTFEQEANFESVIFEGKTEFGLSRKEHDSKPDTKTIFKEKVNFKDAIFEEEADFKHVIFAGEANFTFTTFKDEADFKWARFDSEVIFDNTWLYGRGAFWGIKIDHTTLTFENIKLTDNSNIYFGDIDNQDSKIEIMNTAINGRIDFNEVCIKKVDLRGSNVMNAGVINRINFKADCANWETATFLKHEEIKRDNIIKALEYKAIEKDLYQKELIGKKNKNFRERAEIASILLSKISNNHGQNWVQAVLFTIISGLVFFSVFSFIRCLAPDAPNTFLKLFNPDFSISFIDFFIPAEVQATGESFFKSFVQYYIPVNYNALIEYLGNNQVYLVIRILGTVIYLLGKIAIAYGVVEVVQAFRKLK